MSPRLTAAVWRHSLRHPLQLGLAILGIALGVAVVVSIDLANASALRAFELSAKGLAGRATHAVEGGPDGFPEAVYADLRLRVGIRAMAPVVEGHVVSVEHPGGRFCCSAWTRSPRVVFGLTWAGPGRNGRTTCPPC